MACRRDRQASERGEGIWTVGERLMINPLPGLDGLLPSESQAAGDGGEDTIPGIDTAVLRRTVAVQASI